MRTKHKTTLFKRLGAWALTLALVAGLLPTTAFALDGDKAIMLGTSGIKDPTETTDTKGRGKYYTPNSYIYFGVKGSDPIKWRVLDADMANDGTTSGMFLLSEYLLDSGVVFESAWNSDDNDGQINPNEWQHSDAQNWCSTFATNTDVFSTAEQAAFLGVAKTDSAEKFYKIPWGASSLTEQDKMFFLSARELADYVGNYDEAPGLTATYVGGSAGVWWLRSPYADVTLDAGAVYSNGTVYCDGVLYDWAARPAFNLNRDSVLFTSAAEGGKAASGMDSGLTAVGDYTGSEWKLTLLDSSRNFSVTETTAEVKSGGTITLDYTGATAYHADTAPNEYISAMIVDSSGVQYYGRVAQPTEASGQIQIKIPASLADGTYTLHVFSEQYNGDYKTDYASAFATVDLTVDTTAPTLSGGSAIRDSATTATVKFTSNEAGTYYYVVGSSATAPDSINTSGDGTSCSADTETTITLDSLSGEYIHIVVKDAVNNVSDILTIQIPAYTFTVTVNVDPPSGGTASANYITAAPDTQITLTATPKTGYRFVKWTSSNGVTFADASSASTTFTMPANDTTITANWKRQSSGIVPQKTLTFDTNGGSKISAVTENYGKTIVLADYTPKRDGYKFVGWYKDKELTEKIEYAVLDYDMTVYAKWEKIEETVDYDTMIVLTINDKTSIVNGKAVENDVAPLIVNSRTYTPARFVAEALGAKVVWDEKTKTVTITKDDVKIILVIDSTTAYVNGTKVQMDASAFIADGRTFTPARFVAEHLGASVEWDEEARTVTIAK